MATDWRKLCKGPRVDVDVDDAIVGFENGRKHRVRVRETEVAFEFHAVVARASAVVDVADLPVRIWRHNRSAQLVGFRIDSAGRVCAEGWVPKAGVTAEEFQLVLRRVAAESDRLEFLLTGKDVELPPGEHASRRVKLVQRMRIRGGRKIHEVVLAHVIGAGRSTSWVAPQK